MTTFWDLRLSPTSLPRLDGGFAKGGVAFLHRHLGVIKVVMAIDERGVARKHEMTLRDNVWKWWRNVPGFSQSYEGTIVDNGHTIIGKGKLSKDGVS